MQLLGLPTLQALFSMDGGLEPGQTVLLAGEPGIGKSTALTQLLNGQGVYCSAEEAYEQYMTRCRRLYLPPSTWFDGNEDFGALQWQGADIVVIDSIQTMHFNNIRGFPGDPLQMRSIGRACVENARFYRVPVILISQLQKDGDFAGRMELAHLVDTTLYLERDENRNIRARLGKNRYGPIDKTAIFSMGPTGLLPLEGKSM